MTTWQRMGGGGARHAADPNKMVEKKTSPFLMLGHFVQPLSTADKQSWQNQRAT
ncbi:NH(3)-dependent NAD(+) synthase [Acetobacter orientalis]|uniref:NH(3)-dependent NAD(+) synthase n=1 Tax=Acetobacter orientalis TaxID=146474 RepID=A0A2Z5ZIE6_9PROT|nr:NH(3)-dependent NAD(+) synthase [Acetobacter orientalis]